MHSTSPGVENSVEKLLYQLEFKKYFTQNECNQKAAEIGRAAEPKTTIDSISLISDELNQKIYDDPCDLLNSTGNSTPSRSPSFQVPRSRSWLCCSKPEISNEPNNDFLKCEYNLVTQIPKPDV
jgi:hypothetical protein